MSRLRLILVGLFCIGLILPLSALHAQDDEPTPPLLVFGSAGDLWRYDVATGKAENITESGYIDAPIANPVNTMVAYTTIAQFWIDAGMTEVAIGGPSPNDIWIIDTITGEALQVAEQPEDASVDAGVYATRRDPVWSADGMGLAWTEYRRNADGTDGYSLNIYAVDQKHVFETPLPDDLAYFGIPGPFPLSWSPDSGYLALTYATVDEDTGVVTQSIEFIDMDMTPTTVELAGDVIIGNWLWVSDNDSMKLAIYQGSGAWHLIDPATSEQTTYTDAIQGNAVAGDPIDTVHLIFQNETWFLEFPATTTQQLPIPINYGFLGNIAISPDGLNVAFADDESNLVVLTALGDEVSRLAVPAGIGGITWGANILWETSYLRDIE